MFLNFNDETGCEKIGSSWVESLQLNVSQTINYCTLEVMSKDDEHLKEILCFWKFLLTSISFGTAGLFLASRNLNCCYTTFSSPCKDLWVFSDLSSYTCWAPSSWIWRLNVSTWRWHIQTSEPGRRCSACVAHVLRPHDLFCFLHLFSVLYWLSGEFAGMFTRGEIGCLDCLHLNSLKDLLSLIYALVVFSSWRL